MWKQIERSTPPRPLKRQVDRAPAPPKGPSISSKPKTRRETGFRQKVPLKLAAGLTAGVFSIGLIAGIGIGVFVVDPERPKTNVALPETNDWEQEAAAVDDGYSIPVSVYRSERALKEFVYEETPPPELTGELLGAIPDIGLEPGKPVQLPVPAETASIPPGPEAPESDTVPFTDQQGPIPLIGSTATLAPVEDRPDKRRNLVSLPNASNRDLTEPLTRSPAIPLWRQNAVPITVDYTKPMIAIVIDDVGINQPRSHRAIELTGRLTLAFLPYGYNLPTLVESAKQNGHEVLVHLPTEPLSPDVDPGPNALLTSLSLPEIKRRIDWNLSQFDGYVGLNNHMGSRFTAWTPGMELLIKETKARGLLFLDSITSQDTVGFRLARSKGLPNAVRDVFLDHDQRPEAIARQLRRTEGVAKARGFAIAIGHPHDETLDELDLWLETVEDRGFQLVPISAIVRRNYPQG